MRALVPLVIGLTGCGAEATIPPLAPAISLALSTSSVNVTQGQQAMAALTITRTNFTGPVAVTFNVSRSGLTVAADPATVTANATNLTVAAAGFTEPGTTTVTIAASGAAITTQSTALSVSVTPGNLNVSSNDDLRAEPGRTWRFRGSQASSLTATIDGQLAPVTYEGDSVAVVAVPALTVFQPCLAPSTLDVFLATATGSVHLDVPAEAPLKPTLAGGAHVPLDNAVQRDCRVLLPVGTYAVVAAVPDRQDYVVAAQLRTDSVELQIDLEAASAMAAPHAGQIRLPVLFQDVVPTAPMQWHERPPTPPAVSLPSRTASLSECRLLSGVGDSIEIPTRRDAAGQFRWSSGTDPAEWWHLVARTPNVDFVVDTGGRRVWEMDASIRATIAKVLTLYDTAFVPIWAELYSTPLPDEDGNGRMIWFAPWNSGEGGGGGFGYYLQSGCTGNVRNGENFYGPLDMFSSDPVRTPPYLAAYHRETIMHEAAHTQDLARRAAAHGRTHLWPPGNQISTEGIAVLSTEYWNLKRSGPPFTANQTSILPMTDGITHPGNLWEVFPKITGNYHWDTWANNSGYPQSGRFILWTVAQAVRQGRPINFALTAMATATRATYGAIYRAGTGTTLSDRDVLAAWVLSWYADDRVGGIDPLLDYTPWNTVNAYASRSKPFPLPVTSLTTTGAWAIKMGDPDAKVFVVTASQPLRVRARAVGALSARVALELLRVQ